MWILEVINQALAGAAPNPQLLLNVKRAIHDGQDVYRPAAEQLGNRILEAPGMDVSVDGPKTCAARRRRE